jgi:hypothetical protein
MVKKQSLTPNHCQRRKLKLPSSASFMVPTRGTTQTLATFSMLRLKESNRLGRSPLPAATTIPTINEATAMPSPIGQTERNAQALLAPPNKFKKPFA